MTGDRSAAPLPPNHRMVLEIVRDQGRGQHATTSDIFLKARQRKPGIGYSTVYRALDRLCELGLVSEVRIPGTSSALYEPVGQSHGHFICEACGHVKDLDLAPEPSVFAPLTEGHDIEIRGVSLTLHGLCAACRGREAAPA